MKFLFLSYNSSNSKDIFPMLKHQRQHILYKRGKSSPQTLNQNIERGVLISSP